MKLALAVLIACLPAVGFALIQESGPLALRADRALAAMAEGNWANAMAAHDQLIAEINQDASNDRLEPEIGVLYFRRGLCEMKLKMWKNAMHSFGICYRYFPNPEPYQGIGGNVFHKLALLKWAEAAMADQQWRTALDLFEKFRLERDKERDRFPQGLFYLNRAVCFYQLGELPTGNENFEIALQNRDAFQTPREGIWATMQVLAQAVIKSNEPQAMIDWVRKNQSLLRPQAELAFDDSHALLEIARILLEAKQYTAAGVVYQLIPSSDDVLDQLQKNAGASNRHPQHSRWLENQASESSIDWLKMASLAVIQEQQGLLESALDMHAAMAERFSLPSQRQASLFHAARLSARLGMSGKATYFAECLRRDFPDDLRLDELERMLKSL